MVDEVTGSAAFAKWDGEAQATLLSALFAEGSVLRLLDLSGKKLSSPSGYLLWPHLLLFH